LKGSDQVMTTVGPGSKIESKISDKYAASIQAAIRPNITFDPDTISGNPAVVTQVGLSSDGIIISITIVNSSGIKSWDLAVTRALVKTERLPKDENGRVPPTLEITLRPRER
jgi:colicin import membrane protein